MTCRSSRDEVCKGEVRPSASSRSVSLSYGLLLWYLEALCVLWRRPSSALRSACADLRLDSAGCRAWLSVLGYWERSICGAGGL